MIVADQDAPTAVLRGPRITGLRTQLRSRRQRVAGCRRRPDRAVRVDVPRTGPNRLTSAWLASSSGTPQITREPTITVDAGLPVGRHRFRLEVVDAAGLRSAPDEAIVEVQRIIIDPGRIPTGPVIPTPGPVVGPVIGPVTPTPGPVVGPVVGPRHSDAESDHPSAATSHAQKEGEAMNRLSRAPEADPLYARPAAERPSYATGILLDAQDFTDEQTYHRGRLARALASLTGGGTLAGLRVSHSPATGAPSARPGGDPRRARARRRSPRTADRSAASGVPAAAGAGSTPRSPPTAATGFAAPRTRTSIASSRRARWPKPAATACRRFRRAAWSPTSSCASSRARAASRRASRPDHSTRSTRWRPPECATPTSFTSSAREGLDDGFDGLPCTRARISPASPIPPSQARRTAGRHPRRLSRERPRRQPGRAGSAA